METYHIQGQVHSAAVRDAPAIRRAFTWGRQDCVVEFSNMPFICMPAYGSAGGVTNAMHIPWRKCLLTFRKSFGVLFSFMGTVIWVGGGGIAFSESAPSFPPAFEISFSFPVMDDSRLVSFDRGCVAADGALLRAVVSCMSCSQGREYVHGVGCHRDHKERKEPYPGQRDKPHSASVHCAFAG
jgi:hypothetical protein